MQNLRALAMKQRSWAMMIVALALLVRALIPAGYMIVPNSLTLTVQICSGLQTDHATIDIVVPMSSKGQDHLGDHSQKSPPCAFSALSMASMAGASCPLLALALAYIIAIAVTATAPVPCRSIAHLRPPLRGPPSFV